MDWNILAFCDYDARHRRHCEVRSQCHPHISNHQYIHFFSYLRSNSSLCVHSEKQGRSGIAEILNARMKAVAKCSPIIEFPRNCHQCMTVCGFLDLSSQHCPSRPVLLYFIPANKFDIVVRLGSRYTHRTTNNALLCELRAADGTEHNRFFIRSNWSPFAVLETGGGVDCCWPILIAIEATIIGL